MATNDFLVFAGAGGANVLSQAAYAGLAALGPGFSAGIAPSDACNKVWRQSSIMGSVLAQFIADKTGSNSVDDGTTATLLSDLQSSVLIAAWSADTGTANNYVANFIPAVTVRDGTLIRLRPAHTNTGASTINVNGAGAVGIKSSALVALTGGEIVGSGCLVLEYNVAQSAFVIIAAST